MKVSGVKKSCQGRIFHFDASIFSCKKPFFWDDLICNTHLVLVLVGHNVNEGNMRVSEMNALYLS